MISGFSEKQLSEYLDSRDKRQNSRLMAGRIFRGTVLSVAFISRWACTVTIQRASDPLPDLTKYFCQIPGYFPKVGDVVDLIWRSRDEAVVSQLVFSNFEPAAFFDSGYLSASQANINVAAVPVGFYNLRVYYSARSDHAATSIEYLLFQLNGDASALYSGEIIAVSGVAAPVVVEHLPQATSGRCGLNTGLTANSGYFAKGHMTIPSYGDSVSIKELIWYVAGFSAITTGNLAVYQGAAQYGTAVPVTSMLFFPTGGLFVAGTRFQIFPE